MTPQNVGCFEFPKMIGTFLISDHLHQETKEINNH